MTPCDAYEPGGGICARCGALLAEHLRAWSGAGEAAALRERVAQLEAALARVEAALRPWSDVIRAPVYDASVSGAPQVRVVPFPTLAVAPEADARVESWLGADAGREAEANVLDLPGWMRRARDMEG